MRQAALEQRYNAGAPLVDLRKGEERLANGYNEKQRPRKVTLSFTQVSASSTLEEKSYYAYANLK